VVWKDYRDGQAQLWGMISHDYGVTWREQRLASATGSADHPQLLAHQGRFVVFWNTAERSLATYRLE
jgi:hypothetical protein